MNTPEDVRIVFDRNGLPVIDTSDVPAWVKEVNASRKEDQPFLSEGEVALIRSEARGSFLYEIRGTYTTQDTKGIVNDCYVEVVYRGMAYKIRSIAKWREICPER